MLLEGRLAFEAWAARIPLLDEVLDSQRPVVPGIATEFAPHLPAWQYRESWLLLRNAKCVDDLNAGHLYAAEDGNLASVRVDPSAGGMLRDFGDRYLVRLASISRIAGPLDIEDLVAETKQRCEMVSGRDLGGIDLWTC
jgi:hypothetical protein